jgi:hypothetical protein
MRQCRTDVFLKILQVPDPARFFEIDPLGAFPGGHTGDLLPA